MTDEYSLTELNKWFDSEERYSETSRVDGVYSVSSLDLDDFCDYLAENEYDLIGIPCMVCAEGLWFNEEDFKNASYR